MKSSIANPVNLQCQYNNKLTLEALPLLCYNRNDWICNPPSVSKEGISFYGTTL